MVERRQTINNKVKHQEWVIIDSGPVTWSKAVSVPEACSSQQGSTWPHCLGESSFPRRCETKTYLLASHNKSLTCKNSTDSSDCLWPLTFSPHLRFIPTIPPLFLPIPPSSPYALLNMAWISQQQSQMSEIKGRKNAFSWLNCHSKLCKGTVNQASLTNGCGRIIE